MSDRARTVISVCAAAVVLLACIGDVIVGWMAIYKIRGLAVEIHQLRFDVDDLSAAITSALNAKGRQ